MSKSADAYLDEQESQQRGHNSGYGDVDEVSNATHGQPAGMESNPRVVNYAKRTKAAPSKTT